MRTGRPLLSTRAHPRNHRPQENPSHALTHTHTHNYRHVFFNAKICKHSYNVAHALAHARASTESFIILLLAAISISCAFNAPTSTALPVGEAYPSPPQGLSLSTSSFTTLMLSHPIAFSSVFLFTFNSRHVKCTENDWRKQENRKVCVCVCVSDAQAAGGV